MNGDMIKRAMDSPTIILPDSPFMFSCYFAALHDPEFDTEN
jgi:hypothetical protein